SPRLDDFDLGSDRPLDRFFDVHRDVCAEAAVLFDAADRLDASQDDRIRGFQQIVGFGKDDSGRANSNGSHGHEQHYAAASERAPLKHHAAASLASTDAACRKSYTKLRRARQLSLPASTGREPCIRLAA